ncbi:ankyrin repeat-containing domain protein [Aspergillus karnatakaensis]|uniref:ankyrin repeat domain-containing protein n=1 Tax=Aspergillus karnatakaensis TaxID=1810916 RepID=UPI003CCD5AF3
MIKQSRLSKKQRKRLALISSNFPSELIIYLGAFLNQATLKNFVRVSKRHYYLLTPFLYDSALIHKNVWLKRETSEFEYQYPDVKFPKPGLGYCDELFHLPSLAEWKSEAVLEYWRRKPLEVVMYPSLEYDSDMGETGWTVLHAAAKAGNEILVNLLLDRGVDVDTETFRGATPMDFAIDGREIGVIKLLVARGANVLIHDDPRSLLYRAIVKKDMEVFEVVYSAFKAAGGDIPARISQRVFVRHGTEDRSETYLHLAQEYLPGRAVDMLLADGADPSLGDHKGFSLLHYLRFAAEERVEAVIKRLDAVAGFDFDRPGQYGHTPLHDAVGNDHVKVVLMLIERGAVPFSRKLSQENALELAVRCASKKCIWMFVETHPGIRIDEYTLSEKEKFAPGDYRLDEATRYGGMDAETLVLVARLKAAGVISAVLNVDMERFSEHAAQVLDCMFKHGQDSLHRCLPVIRAVVEAGVDVDCRRWGEQTTRLDALLAATVPGAHSDAYYEILVLILGTSQAVNAQHKSGDTPLHVAVTKGDVKIVELLLARLGTKSVNAKNKQGYTPLQCAIGCHNSEAIVQALVMADASVTGVCKGGRTALHLAAGVGDQLPTLRILLSRRPRINAPDESGNPPVHYAAKSGWDAGVGAFVEAGALSHLGCPTCEERMAPWKLDKNGRDEALQALSSSDDVDFPMGQLSIFS